MRRIKSMNCREVQKRLIPFVDDKLSIPELDAFLRHMDNCPNCREEYDVYYTMLMGMRYLESDSTGELKMDSEQKLLSAEEYLFRYKIVLVEKIFCFAMLCVGAVLLL